MADMATQKAALSLASTSTAVLNAKDAIATSVAAVRAAETRSSNTFGLFGRIVLSILGVLPTVLYWITYGLPAWLFTLFSMSLTFTMNFTTL
jgi:lysophospholipid hydrolase